ncbi:DUF3502 domain-containing protein [Paenibacillus sp. MCAF20]
MNIRKAWKRRRATTWSGVEKAVSEYIETQKKNGLDKIIAETQKQIDAFLASKK